MSGRVGSPTSHFLLSSAQGPQGGSGLRLGALAWGPALPCLVKPPFPGAGGGQSQTSWKCSHSVPQCPLEGGGSSSSGDVTQMLNRQHGKGTVPGEQLLVGQCWLLPCPSACLAHRTAAVAGRTGTRRAVSSLSGPFFGHCSKSCCYIMTSFLR